MPYVIETIPCLSDNYAFLLHESTGGATLLFDVPETGPIAETLHRKGWTLSHVLITHHHDDHVQGLGSLLARHPAEVIGAAADAHRLPPLDRTVEPGARLDLGGVEVDVIGVPGHTSGHVAYHVPAAGALFSADSLMALGCGRVFEGTHDQMFASLMRLAELPPETLVCSGHEYTAANGRFAMTVEPDNPALKARIAEIAETRAQGLPTVPSRLADELATNPYLRTDNDAIAVGLGMSNASPVEIFSRIRNLKDSFRG